MRDWRARIASPEEVALFQDKVALILEERGIKLDHPVVLRHLLGAGATQDAQGYVHFPRPLQAQALESAPRQYLCAGQDEVYDCLIPHPQDLFYAKTPIGQMFYLDALTGQRTETTMATQLDYIKVQQALPHISFWGNFTVKPDGFPPEALDIHAAELCMLHCKKPGFWMSYHKRSPRYVIEMAQAIAGGKDALAKRPFLTMEPCAASPLGLNYLDCEVILQGALNRIPLTCASLPTAGANAPITPEGVALLAVTEALAQAIMAQIICPGTPVMLGALNLSIDMRTMATISCTSEMLAGQMLCTQVVRDGYNLPFFTTAAGTNSHLLDAQCFAEDASTLAYMSSAGATLLGNVGTYDNWITASPLHMIIGNDLVAAAKQVKRGVEVDEERMALEDILTKNVGEPFLQTDHTLDHYTEIIYPAVVQRNTRPAWEAAGEKDLLEYAREEYRKIIENHQPVNHPPEVLRELESIVARADRELSQ